MGTSEDINGIIDAVMARITANITSLGGTSTTPVVEGDEIPAQIREFPKIYVLPLVPGGDKISQKMSSSPRLHEFDLTLAGVYKATSVITMLRTVRDYGYAAADLFSLENQKVTSSGGLNAYCLNPVVVPGYHQVGTYFVMTWSVQLHVKMATE